MAVFNKETGTTNFGGTLSINTLLLNNEKLLTEKPIIPYVQVSSKRIRFYSQLTFNSIFIDSIIAFKVKKQTFEKVIKNGFLIGILLSVLYYGLAYLDNGMIGVEQGIVLLTFFVPLIISFIYYFANMKNIVTIIHKGGEAVIETRGITLKELGNFINQVEELRDKAKN